MLKTSFCKSPNPVDPDVTKKMKDGVEKRWIWCEILNPVSFTKLRNYFSDIADRDQNATRQPSDDTVGGMSPVLFNRGNPTELKGQYMSEFSKEMVLRVAHLARLSFSEEELGKFSRQLSDIVGYVEKLGELDTADVEPLGTPFELPPSMREDEAVESMSTDDLLANAPGVKSGHFVVPKVI